MIKAAAEEQTDKKQKWVEEQCERDRRVAVRKIGGTSGKMLRKERISNRGGMGQKF